MTNSGNASIDREHLTDLTDLTSCVCDEFWECFESERDGFDSFDKLCVEYSVADASEREKEKMIDSFDKLFVEYSVVSCARTGASRQTSRGASSRR